MHGGRERLGLNTPRASWLPGEQFVNVIGSSDATRGNPGSEELVSCARGYRSPPMIRGMDDRHNTPGATSPVVCVVHRLLGGPLTGRPSSGPPRGPAIREDRSRRAAHHDEASRRHGWSTASCCAPELRPSKPRLIGQGSACVHPPAVMNLVPISGRPRPDAGGLTVSAAHTAVFLALAVLRFHRRDVTA